MIAENFLTDVECFNQTRGMLGYTGNYQGKRVSVMGHGMGIPSHRHLHLRAVLFL